jgi:hypothetical protein
MRILFILGYGSLSLISMVHNDEAVNTHQVREQQVFFLKKK